MRHHLGNSAATAVGQCLVVRGGESEHVVDVATSAGHSRGLVVEGAARLAARLAPLLATGGRGRWSADVREDVVVRG